MAKRPVKIVEAVGSAASARDCDLGNEIQAAMTAASQKCFDKGITDPAKIRKAMLDARETVKANRAKAAKKAKPNARPR